MRLFTREKRPTRVVDWLNARLSLIFGLVLAMFLLSVGVSFYAFSIQRHADDQKVLLREDAGGILQAMSDQETGLRGYLSDNNPAFFVAFQQGRPAYLTFADDLTRQLQSGPFRLTAIRLTAVEELADEWYSNFALAQIAQMQAGHFAGPRSQASILQGNILFNQFRAAVGKLQEAIGQDLEGYQNQVEPLTFSDLDQVGQSINSMADAIQRHEHAAEESMRTLEHQYALVERAQSESRAIFDASSEAFLFISAGGQVHALNRPFREFFALTGEEVVGMSFADLQHRWEPHFVNAASFHADLVQDSLHQERYHTTTVIQQDPEYRELAVSSIPVRSSTTAYLGRLYVLRDITREREAERLKAEFYALISHGLRNPLTSIKGYTDLLAEQEETGPLNELQQEFLGIVQSNARRLVALINDLIDLSRLEAQTMVIRAVPLALHALIHDVTRSMRPQHEERRQRLSLQLAPAPLLVLGDENRVGQILTNLLAFVTIHTPLGGRMVLETQQVDSMVRITCSSSGDLSDEDLAAFNRPFLHASALPSSETVGSMLGPSIARSLVELHGGTLQMSSAPGEGSTLTCTLPSSPSQAPIGEDSPTGHAGDRRYPE